MHKHNAWYIRKDNRLTGPFPSGQISQLLVVGRLSLQDEVSHDKENWAKIASIEYLIPEVIIEDSSDEGIQERLAAARRWADERREERRKEDPLRQKKGRRHVESTLDTEYRFRRESIYRSFRERPKSSILILMGLVIVVGTLITLSFRYSGVIKFEDPVCDASPAPAVNWRNCLKLGVVALRTDLSNANMHSAIMRGSNFFASDLHHAMMNYVDLSDSNLSYTNMQNATLVGADLQKSDLRYANLQGANLSYANLSGANLVNIKLDNANLSNAIWQNGQTCLPGSYSECRIK